MDDLGRPFESLESAQEFMELLSECVEEVRVEIEVQRAEAASGAEERREEAFHLVLHKLKQTSFHVHRTQRMLNDLRILRRLLYDERGASRTEEAVASRMNGTGQ